MRKDGEGMDVSATVPVVIIIYYQCATGAVKDNGCL